MERVPTYRPSLEEALGGKPTKAEKTVLAHAKAGTVAPISPFGVRPQEPSPITRIRAGLIRFLMLGGDDAYPIHPRGVLIQGAWIAGKLDMEACETQLDLKLWACHFDTAPDFDDAHVGGLYMPGCHLPGMRGQRMRLEENLHLRALPRDKSEPLPFVATGSVDIAGAWIAGPLDCSGGRFYGAKGAALRGEAMTVGADVFLRNSFHATGKVILSRAAITGQFSCVGGRFDGAGEAAMDGDAMSVGADVFLSDGFHATGEVNLIRAKIIGNLRATDAQIEGVFDLGSARVGEGLFFKNVLGVGFDGPWLMGKSPSSPSVDTSRLVVDLTEAEAGVLADDASSWGQVQALRLSGFRFRSVQSRMTAAERAKLLKRSHQDELAVTASGKRHFRGKPNDFDPRAYGELARAYLRQGERKAAALVLEAREDRSRDAELRRAQAEEMPGGGLAVLGARLRWIAMWVFKALFGYGHRPARIFWTLIPLWVLLAWFFDTVFDKGQFAPNSDSILTSAEWRHAVQAGCPLPADETYAVKKAEGCKMPLTLWVGDFGRELPPADAAKDYETLEGWLYAADLFLPLDAIGQTEAWAPSKDPGKLGLVGLLPALSGAAVRLDHHCHVRRDPDRPHWSARGLITPPPAPRSPSPGTSASGPRARAGR